MLHIPEDKLPPEYKDEARLDSLYSPFRSHSVNPKDWDSKISSWKHLISLYCINNGVYSFTLTRLNKLFLRNGRPPKCLPTVLEELLKAGELQHLEDFLRESSKTWGGWATDLLIKKPISWSFSTVKNSLFSSQVDPEHTLVHVEVIRTEAQKLLTNIPEKNRNKVIDFEEFLKLVSRDLSQADDVKLLLHHLVKERKVDLKNIKDNVLIKVSSDKAKTVQISETDVALYVLEQNEKLFTKHVEDLEDEISSCIRQIKSHLLKGHRQLAKTCLRKKHEIQKRLTNKTNALHNVQVLLERIRDVHGDAAVWQSYKQALSAFNATVKETGLTEDAVEDTMLKLGEMLDIHQDIQSAISKPVIVEDEDLEDELAELLKSDEELKDTTPTELDDLDEQLAKLDISNLPDVPSANVSAQRIS